MVFLGTSDNLPLRNPSCFYNCIKLSEAPLPLVVSKNGIECGSLFCHLHSQFVSLNYKCYFFVATMITNCIIWCYIITLKFSFLMYCRLICILCVVYWPFLLIVLYFWENSVYVVGCLVSNVVFFPLFHLLSIRSN